MNRYFNPESEVSTTENNLPHWHQDHTYCFITWRMGDSLPKAKLDEWSVKKAEWLRQNPKPWCEKQQQEYKDTFHDTVDAWLDAGAGSCLLGRKQYREVVIEALHYRNNKEYELEAYVIMPNHVHLLICLMETPPLPKIMQGLKRHTARQINLLRGVQGSFWQGDYYDTLIRSPQHLAYVRNYIRKNPSCLRPSQFSLWERSRE